MAYAIENFTSGSAQFTTFNGPGSIGSARAGNINTSGTNRLVVIAIGTGRSKPPGDTAIINVASIAATGLTFTKVLNDEYTYTFVGADSSFPNACFSWDVFTAPAAAAQTNLSWTSTASGDGIINNQVAFVFAISGLADINDVDLTELRLSQDLGPGPSVPDVKHVDSDGEAVFIACFTARNNGFTFVGPESGYTISQNTGGGHGTTNAKMAMFRGVESTSIANKTLGDTGTTDYWHGFALGFGSTSGLGQSIVSTVALDVMHSGASTALITEVALDVLHVGSSDAQISTLALEVLRSVADSTGADGDANGVTITNTITLNAGEFVEPQDADADGATLTITSSVATEGHAGDTTEIDGTEIYEVTFNTIPSGQYQESDYYSIYSIGSRWQNGLIVLTDLGVGPSSGATPQGAFDNSYGEAAGSGWNPDSGPGALGMTFQTGTLLNGMRFIGASEISTRTSPWQIRAGMSATQVYPESFAQEFDYFQTSQNAGLIEGLHYSELLMTPRTPILWPYYEFRTAGDPVTERFAEEIEFKVFHSILDGGDRRSTNGRPSKQVVLTLSSDWGVDTSSPDRKHPSDAWLDGSVLRSNAGTSGGNASFIGANAGGGALGGAQTTVGAYIQFVFPRPVIHQHLVLQVTSPEVYDSGEEPTRYGKWHWEYSKNNGTSWVSLGGTWWFHEDAGQMMLAPHTGERFSLDGDVALGTGATHWRMVLDEGPAFGGARPAYEIQFNVIDSQELVSSLTIAFTDDADGVLPVVTVGPSGSPYVVAFTDGTDDKLTLNLENTPNPVLTIAFTDEGEFDTWSDLYPMTTVQTIVVATGRA